MARELEEREILAMIFIVIVLIIFICNLSGIVRAFRGDISPPSDTLAQQIEAIDNTTLLNDDKAKVISELIAKYRVVSNSVPTNKLDVVIETDRVEKSNQ